MKRTKNQRFFGAQKNKVFLAKILLLMLLILLPTISAYEIQDILTAEEITTKVDMSSSVDFIRKGQMFEIKLFKTKLYNYPRNYDNQEVISIHTIPMTEDRKDWLEYRWLKPKEGISYQLTSTVKTYNRHNPIKEKIVYPIQEDLKRGYNIFLTPTKYIDSTNPEIQAKAQQITAGETDLYITVSKISDWVNKQVNYNITTKTEKATQKASWVLANKQGVCDEITALFIALLRASGIPARFVSGISYTNNPYEGKNWGGHGWAEVYYPEKGWLPYDITFGQYGWIDAGHIKLKDTLDPRDKPTRFEWEGRDSAIDAKKLNVDTKIQELTGKISPVIEIKIITAKQKIGLNSHNLVVAEVKNLKDFYITKELIMTDVAELEIIGLQKKIITLKPNERTKLFWRVHTKNNLNPDYRYDIPIEIYTTTGEKGREVYTARKDYKDFSLNDIVKMQDAIEAGEEITQEDYTPKKEIKQEELEEKLSFMQKIIKWIKELFK